MLEYTQSDVEMNVYHQEYVVYSIECPDCKYNVSVGRWVG